MPTQETDFEILTRMRTDLDLYLDGDSRLDSLIRKVDTGSRELQACEPRILEELRQELRELRDISAAARKAGETPPLTRHLRRLEDSVTVLSRLLWHAMKDTGEWKCEDDIDFLEDDLDAWCDY